MKREFTTIVLVWLSLASCFAKKSPNQIVVDNVLSDFPVGFCLLTQGNLQFVAYYDPDHVMTVAKRTLDSSQWQYQKLPSVVGADSHNNIVMAIDDEGYIHLSGNMHVSKLTYFRTSRPLDITSFKEIDKMTGEKEDSVTYPAFMRGNDGSLIFHYRYGHSGQGIELYNIYDLKTQSWHRLLNTPLTDGEGLMNAYMKGPTYERDGYFHLVWVWRDSYLCETNHTLSYARSKDLVHWEDAFGRPAILPITLNNHNLWVDPVPTNGGILNGQTFLGLDSQNRPIISYFKFDENGFTQIYLARPNNGLWIIRPITTWNYRWWFDGGGSINNELRISPPREVSKGIIRVDFDHIEYGKGYVLVDEIDLSQKGQIITGKTSLVVKSQAVNPILSKRWISKEDCGESSSKNAKYMLTWEAYPTNRDSIRTHFNPEPSTLYVVKK